MQNTQKVKTAIPVPEFKNIISLIVLQKHFKSSDVKMYLCNIFKVHNALLKE